MTMTRCVAGLLLALFAFPVIAHDFWIRPESFVAVDSKPLTIAFMVGHADDVGPWDLRWERLNTFFSVGPQGLADQQAGVPTDPANEPGARVALRGEGTHIVAMTSYHAFSELPAAEFEDYLVKEGLAAAAAARKAAGTTGEPGRELYARRAKALVQVGGAYSDAVTRPIGHTLEIVPLRNPLAPSADTRLPVRVLLHGRPLAGALVDLTALDFGTEPVQPQRTDADGRASFVVPRTGAWKINVIWSRPIEGRQDADFETLFTSLTFGYPAQGDAGRVAASRQD